MKKKRKNGQKIILVIILLSIIGIYLVGKAHSINQEDNNVANKEKNLPGTNHTCENIAPENLKIRLLDTLTITLIPDSNFLMEGAKFKGVCERHSKAKPGEYEWVEKLFTCSSFEIFVDGGTTEEGIVEQDYNIHYVFEMDERNCEDFGWWAGEGAKSCNITSLNCNWEYIN